jgi:formylglycine-generating enzyme required for sulfatase activity
MQIRACSSWLPSAAVVLLLPLAASAVTIDWVTVGAPGNACDPQSQGCFGAVADTYLIGKYEVTNAQYAAFLNAVAATDTYALYNTSMGTPTSPNLGGITQSGSPGSYTYSAIAGREDMPVNFVSFYDALRFTNWLHNDQPTGAQDGTTTEDGAYTITADGIADNSIMRNAGATIFLPSEDEWYKAAYYDAISTSYNPYPFADGFDGVMCEIPPGGTSHSANCWSSVQDLTDVGSYAGSASPYGTFDQGGNIWEWNDTTIDGGSSCGLPVCANRGIRGGGRDAQPLALAAVDRSSNLPDYSDAPGFGFRVASIPEPSTALLLASGLAALGVRQRRRPWNP